MEISVEAAQTNLSDLIDTALAGQEVIITEQGRAVAKLVPLVAAEKRRFRIGILKELAGTEPDFFEPMSEEDLRLWEGGDEFGR